VVIDVCRNHGGAMTATGAERKSQRLSAKTPYLAGSRMGPADGTGSVAIAHGDNSVAEATGGDHNKAFVNGEEHLSGSDAVLRQFLRLTSDPVGQDMGQPISALATETRGS
jgi:hypothetical protein